MVRLRAVAIKIADNPIGASLSVDLGAASLGIFMQF
jgi:hypothetical protein